MCLLSMVLTKYAPESDAINAAMVHPAKIIPLNFTCLAYLTAATAVPANEGIFTVPNNVATGYCGRINKVAGVCNKPPPPTMASIKPAPKAARQSKISSVVNVWILGRQI